MKQKGGARTRGWTVDAYATEGRHKPLWAFIQVALVKLLEAQGSGLRRPQSAALGGGLFELRGRQIRLFYTFLPEHVIVLLDGEIKNRNDIPPKPLERMRVLQADVFRRGKTLCREGTHR